MGHLPCEVFTDDMLCANGYQPCSVCQSCLWGTSEGYLLDSDATPVACYISATIPRIASSIAKPSLMVFTSFPKKGQLIAWLPLSWIYCPCGFQVHWTPPSQWSHRALLLLARGFRHGGSANLSSWDMLTTSLL